MDTEDQPMKVKISVLALTLVIIFGVGLSSAQVSSPVYLGQTTWSLKITDNTIDPFMVGQKLILKGGITKVGDNYYLFQGTMMYGTGRKVLSGGGVLINTKLYLSVNESVKFSEDRDNGVMHFILNKDTLNGSVTEVGKSVIPPNSFGPGFYFAGTLTRTGPMIPLN
jgi:hypothetical protein